MSFGLYVLGLGIPKKINLYLQPIGILSGGCIRKFSSSLNGKPSPAVLIIDLTQGGFHVVHHFSHVIWGDVGVARVRFFGSGVLRRTIHINDGKRQTHIKSQQSWHCVFYPHHNYPHQKQEFNKALISLRGS